MGGAGGGAGTCGEGAAPQARTASGALKARGARAAKRRGRRTRRLYTPPRACYFPLLPGMASRARDYLPGEHVPGTVYEVVRLIGAGGMGTVYDVEDTTIGKRYVLKTLHAQLGAREDLARRMQSEARTLARLHHPNIVDIITAGVTGDELKLPYYVMERLDGHSLRYVLDKGGQLELPHAYHIANQSARRARSRARQGRDSPRREAGQPLPPQDGGGGHRHQAARLRDPLAPRLHEPRDGGALPRDAPLRGARAAPRRQADAEGGHLRGGARPLRDDRRARPLRRRGRSAHGRGGPPAQAGAAPLELRRHPARARRPGERLAGEAPGAAPARRVLARGEPAQPEEGARRRPDAGVDREPRDGGGRGAADTPAAPFVHVQQPSAADRPYVISPATPDRPPSTPPMAGPHTTIPGMPAPSMGASLVQAAAALGPTATSPQSVDRRAPTHSFVPDVLPAPRMDTQAGTRRLRRNARVQRAAARRARRLPVASRAGPGAERGAAGPHAVGPDADGAAVGGSRGRGGAPDDGAGARVGRPRGVPLASVVARYACVPRPRSPPSPRAPPAPLPVVVMPSPTAGAPCARRHAAGSQRCAPSRAPRALRPRDAQALRPRRQADRGEHRRAAGPPGPGF